MMRAYVQVYVYMYFSLHVFDVHDAVLGFRHAHSASPESTAAFQSDGALAIVDEFQSPSNTSASLPKYYCSRSRKMWCRVEQAHSEGNNWKLKYVCNGQKLDVTAIGNERLSFEETAPFTECSEAGPVSRVKVYPDPSFEIVQQDSDEWMHLQKFMSPDPRGRAFFGKSHDVKKEREPYNDIELVTAWKVGRGDGLLDEYIKTVSRLNDAYAKINRNGEWVSTFHDDLQHELHAKGILSDNEYWLLRGVGSMKALKLMLRRTTRDGPSDASMGYYGSGTYFADTCNKADQYVREKVDLHELAEMVGPEQTAGMNESQGDIFLLPVFRVYLGANVQMSFENLKSQYGKGNAEPRRWHYVYHASVYDDPEHRFDKQVPPASYDSVKMMGQRAHPEFGSVWNFEKPEWAMPTKDDEFLIPLDLTSDISPRWAPQYIVAYRRLWSDKYA